MLKFMNTFSEIIHWSVPAESPAVSQAKVAAGEKQGVRELSLQQLRVLTRLEKNP